MPSGVGRVGTEQTAGGVQNRGRGETLFAITARRMIVLCTNRRLGGLIIASLCLPDGCRLAI